MRASIVIASHNEGDRLWKTVQSCVETCGNLDHEIVIADDASTDGSLEEATRRFSHVRACQHDVRQGASATKALGAREARGDVLVFLDGHTRPEHQSIARLVEDIEALNGQAIVTPEVPALDARRWVNSCCQSGNGYWLKLERFDCGWLELDKLKAAKEAGRKFYESPALIGCALAVSRELYDKLRQFDPHMRIWGSEDLDFGLKCWLMGHRILHDPQAVIGHRFRASFDNYSVPLEHVVANQLRMARKNFGQAVWIEWLDRCRQRNNGRLKDHPEGLWARAWQLFEADRASVEQERSHLHAHRVRDEFWFAERFGLIWPRLATNTVSISKPAQPTAVEALAEPSPSPSPNPSPSPSPAPQNQCGLTGITPASGSYCAGKSIMFTAQGTNLDSVQWSSAGDPKTGKGHSYEVKLPTGEQTVTATCAGATGLISQTATVTMMSFSLEFAKTEVRPGVQQSRYESVKLTVTRTGGGPQATIHLSSSNPQTATVSPVSFTLAEGQPEVQQTVTVSGVQLSGANQDTQLTASVDLCPDAQQAISITVIEPRNWTCDGLGATLTNETPELIRLNLPQLAVQWGVQWQDTLTFTVQDQFGVPLGQPWTGAELFENASGEWTGFGSDKPLAGAPLGVGAQAFEPVVTVITQSEDGTTLTQQTAQSVVNKNTAPIEVDKTNIVGYRVTDPKTGVLYALSGTNRRKIAVTDKAEMIITQEKQ